MRALFIVLLTLATQHVNAFSPASAFPSTRTRSNKIISASTSSPAQLHYHSHTSLSAVPAFITSLPPAKVAGLLVGLVAFFVGLDKLLWKPSRTYDQEANSVGREYDAWEEEGILEAYWGEHIHLGYYPDEEIPSPDFLPPKYDFIKAKYDFIDEMLRWAGINVNEKSLKKVLDVGCGIGGTSRYLARAFGPETEVTGITLSQNQVNRATELAKEQNTPNAKFQVMDALNMEFPDNSFDIVWACESGEHMPDKKKYVEEMTRVLKPNGRIAIATWCQRDEGNVPFNNYEKKMLNFLYSEWTHPYFISISDYAKIMLGTNQLESIVTDDWTKNTITSWLHSIWVGVFDPRPVLAKPRLWLKTFRDGLALFRMHKSFKKGLMQYGMMHAVKKAAA